MSHYTIQYDLSDIPASDAKALKDCANWLGSEENLQDLLDHIKQFIDTPLGLNFDQLAFSLEFAGIQGYTVYAIARKLGIPIPQEPTG